MTERELVFRPIGVAHTPFRERVDAPRQSVVAKDVTGTVELFAGFEDALDGIDTFSHLWLLFAFHLNEGWTPKVLPPRAEKKVGVLASRSPYRPNPIGMSVVELVRVSGLVLHVRSIDLLDGTPILDIKPYVAYADAVANATDGWLSRDPREPWRVELSPAVETRVRWLAERGVALEASIREKLALGPQPHAYRRIRPDKDRPGHAELSLKEWRVYFRVLESSDTRVIVVEDLYSGYRPAQLADPSRSPELHRTFGLAFPRG